MRKISVAQLIEMLQRLPEDTRLMLADTCGIEDMAGGNLCPMKVLTTEMGTFLFFDDGFGVHEGMDRWVPLDEFKK